MQQDKQPNISSPTRSFSQANTILRRPLQFIPFDEDFDQLGRNEEYQYSTTDIDLLSGAQGPNAIDLQTPRDGVPIIPNTRVSSEELPILPKTPWGVNGVHTLPSIDLNGGAPYHTLSGYTSSREGLFPGRSVPHSEISVSMPTEFNYDELDDQLEDELYFSQMSTVRLMQLSGMMQAISKPMPVVKAPQRKLSNTTTPPSGYRLSQVELLERISTMPLIATVPITPAPVTVKPISTWKVVLEHPFSKTALGLAIGVVTILLLSRLIDFKATVAVLQQHLTTPTGIAHACIGAIAFALAFTLRGARWKLFLNRISNVSVFKVIRIYWIGVFINFLLPVQGGEFAKSIMLKKVAGIPISQSLPIVAMDKTLDLMPVLVIIAIMPLIPGIHMNVTLSLVMYLVASILVTLMVVVALTWWKREFALKLISFFLKPVPKRISVQIEGFGMGFVDSLIEGLKRPGSFVPAALLTALAILCEGILAWQVAQAVGMNTMGLGIATFGYTIFTMFSILPTPPAQVGTNEGAKIIVFSSLLGFNKNSVLGMSLISHVIGIVLMSTIGIASMWSLGLTLDSVLNLKKGHHEGNQTLP